MNQRLCAFSASVARSVCCQGWQGGKRSPSGGNLVALDLTLLQLVISTQHGPALPMCV